MALINGSASSETLNGTIGIDTINAFGGDDVLVGMNGADALRGGDGNDDLLGGEGFDWLAGGAGNDTLRSVIDSNGVPDKVIDGGEGVDVAVLDYSTELQATTLDLSDPTTRQDVQGTRLVNVEQVDFTGGFYADKVTGGALADTLAGGRGSDSLTGGGGDDVIDGGAGDDLLTGGTGHDVIAGGAGNDGLAGGSGDDSISGGAGKDVLSGDEGADIFSFAALDSRPGGGARDVILDFQSGVDRIDVSALGISNRSALTSQVVGSGMIIYADLDGDGIDSADFALQLNGVTSPLGDGDFIFA
jgi:Ca2+-binding RTX toxin-like protein